MPLAVCATPIGNLEDVTLRVLASWARRTSSSARTRATRKGCSTGTGSTRKLLSYHRHNEAARTAGSAAARGRRADRTRPRCRPPGGQRSRRTADPGRARGRRARDGAAGAVRGRDGTRRERARRRALPVPGLPAAGEQALTALWQELAHRRIPRWRSSRRSGCRRRSARWRRRCRTGRRRLPRADEAVRGGRARSPPRGRAALRRGAEGRGHARLRRSGGAGPAEDESEAVAAVGELVAAGVPRRQAADVVARLTRVSRNTLYAESLKSREPPR